MGIIETAKITESNVEQVFAELIAWFKENHPEALLDIAEMMTGLLVKQRNIDINGMDDSGDIDGMDYETRFLHYYAEKLKIMEASADRPASEVAARIMELVKKWRI